MDPPAASARRQIGEAHHAEPHEAACVGVERMARQIETDRLELVLQTLDRRPVVGSGQSRRQRLCRRAAEEAHLLRLAVVRRRRRVAQQQLDRAKGLRAVAVERIERTRLHQAFELAAVEALGVEAAGEIEEVGEAAVLRALGDDKLHRLRAHALHRGERIADRRALRRGLDGEGIARAVDVRRQERDAETHAFLAEEVELVGIADVEAHQRRHELDRVIGLEIGGLVGDERVGGGVRLVEAVAGEFRDLLEHMLGDVRHRRRARRRRR